jgi:hypothetical protein
MDREPHIGEYDAKTNAICDFAHLPAATDQAETRPATARAGQEAALLPVGLEHLIAGRGQFGPIFLKTRQNDEITLIHHGTTEALNIARTSLLFFGRAAALLLLGDGSGGHRYRQQHESQEKFMHGVPSF